MKRFSKSVLAQLDDTRLLGVRSGDEHKFTRIWVVVVGDRVLIRSWNNKRTGWYESFRANPFGEIDLAGRLISIRTKPVKGERLLDLMDAAYAEKYNTKGSLKYVRGFRTTRRRMATLELLQK